MGCLEKHIYISNPLWASCVFRHEGLGVSIHLNTSAQSLNVCGDIMQHPVNLVTHEGSVVAEGGGATQCPPAIKREESNSKMCQLVTNHFFYP